MKSQKNRVVFKPKRFLGLWAAALVMGAGQVLSHEMVDEHQLFELPLQDLLNISVVSKQSESVARSPGVVSTYRAQDLKALGLHSLGDFIHFVPGVEINEQINRLSVVQIRGLPANSDQKILFMVDSVPYWMPENGEFPLNGIPLEAVEKIEVIRGPGSVVYGTNASAGVINVILRKDQRASVRAHLNDEGRKNTSLYFGGRATSGWWADVAGEVQRDNGYDYGARNAFAPNPGPGFSFPETASGDLERKQEHASFLTRIGNDYFTLMMQTFGASELGDINGSVVSPSEYLSTGTLVSAKLRLPLHAGEFNVFSDWNRYHRDVNAENNLVFFGLDSDGGTFFENNGDNTKRFRNGLSLQKELNEDFSFLAGAEYEERSLDDKKFRDGNNGADLTTLTGPPFNFPFQLQPDGTLLLAEASTVREASGYGQLDYHHARWRFVGGLRYTDNSAAGSDISPRGSVVYSWEKGESVKLLYSEGFNSPTVGQSNGTDRRGVPLNNEVKAETIHSYELALTKSEPLLHQVLSLFHVEVEDLIRSSGNNPDRIERNGLEYEMWYRGSDMQWFAGLSYIHEGNGHGDDEDSRYASRWLSKLGFAKANGAHEWGASLRSAGPREGVDAYHLMNVHYRYHHDDSFEVFSTITNVFNDVVEHPDVANLDRLVIEASDGLGVLVGFVYRPEQQ
ncbi:MAG: TonB-dependent receptor [Oleiphilaceae bacterium]|nr:TonB-dependent receptor [Oleiphilaceae bacterium]